MRKRVGFILLLGAWGGAAAATAAPTTPLQPGTPGSADTTRVYRSVFDQAPGWYPPADPESMSVITGRRKAPLVTMPLSGGAGSLDGLARRALRALEVARPESMHVLCVTRAEFETILWPEFPQSRPATGLTAEDGWRALGTRLTSGTAGAMTDHGRHTWTLVRVERPTPPDRYRNFVLHRGLTLVVKDADGVEQRWDWLRTVVERKGRFKIYSMRD